MKEERPGLQIPARADAPTVDRGSRMTEVVSDLRERDQAHNLGWAIAIFLIFALGIGAAGLWYYSAQRKGRLAESERQLSAIADLKIHEIANWRQERMGDAAVTVSNPYFAPHLRSILSGPISSESKAGLLAWMESLRKAAGYSKVLLLDAHTRTLLQTEDPADPTLDDITRRAAETALRENRPAFSDLHFTDERGTVRMDVLAPISGTGSSAATLGVFVFRIDPYRYLYPFIQTWPTESATAETLLVRRDGNDVLYLNELRHRKGTALRLSFPISTDRLPAAMAVRGFQGIVQGHDYRDVSILAAVRAIPDSPWFFIAKVDLEEIMVPIRREGTLLAIVGLGLIAAAGTGIGYVVRSEQVRHLRRERAGLEERRALVQHFEYLTKFANDAILLLDKDGWFTEVNEQACSAYGYSREELLRLNLRDIHSPDLPDGDEAILASVRDEGGRIFESVHVRKDGTSFPVEISAHRLPAGDRAFFQYVVRDITEMKKAEGEIGRLNAGLEERVRLRTTELEAAMKELQAFSYSVSHDLRAPLRVIDGYSLALLEEYQPRLDGEAVFYLSRIRINAQNMGRLIDDMLTLAQASQTEIRIEDVDLSALARKSAAEIALGWPGRDVAVSISDGLAVRSDPRLLRSVLDNLFDNAWKFTAKTPGARVEFGVRPGGSEGPVYFIRDNGVGFDMTYAGKLFGIFQRLHPQDEFSGTGIGLASVKRIIGRLGGRVWAESEMGRGATFYFTLGSGTGGPS
jgi:PAS domain S-box-containing protein